MSGTSQLGGLSRREEGRVSSQMKLSRAGAATAFLSGCRAADPGEREVDGKVVGSKELPDEDR
jgi:hypothetical protein